MRIRCAARGLLVAAVLFTPACGASERDTSPQPGERRVLRIAGGQTGAEGAVMGSGSCNLPVPFPVVTREEVLSLATGEHHTTLAFRPEVPGPPGGLVVLTEYEHPSEVPMSVRMEPRGEVRLGADARAPCGASASVEVEVTASFEQPALDLVFEATFIAYSRDAGTVGYGAWLDATVADLLGLPSAGFLMLSVERDGPITGALTQVGTEWCGEVTFPAGARCRYAPSSELELDARLHGVRPRDALTAALERIDGTALRWADGTETELSVELVSTPGWACGDASTCLAGFTIPAIVRVATADGRIDHELSFELYTTTPRPDASASDCAPEASAHQGERLHLRSAALIPRTELRPAMAALVPSEVGTDFDTVQVTLGLSGGATAGIEQAELTVRAVVFEPGPDLGAPFAATVPEGHLGCLRVAEGLAGYAELPDAEEL